MTADELPACEGNDGRTEVLAYGIAFCRKRCRVVCEGEKKRSQKARVRAEDIW